jgi:hypothetical protein
MLTGEVLTMAMVISLLAIVSKLIGCGLPLLREGWPTALRVGVGMMPRGEVTLIVALVGLQSGILSQSAYGILVLMTVVTTILAPPLLRVLFRSQAKNSAEDIPAPAEPSSVAQASALGRLPVAAICNDCHLKVLGETNNIFGEILSEQAFSQISF